MSQRKFHDSALYTDLYRQFDIEDDLCIGIVSGPHRCIGLAWHRDSLFTDREQSLAALARPHVVQAWRNAGWLCGMQSQLRALNDGLEGAELGVISCDAEGRVRFATALAREYLAEYFFATKRLDRELPLELHRWMRRRLAELKTNELPPVELPHTVQKAEKCLTVRLLSRAGSVLLLMEEKKPAQGVPGLEAYCLSGRESEVLAWVARGKTNGEIAAILNISLTTAKKHMEHIFNKLQVETRTAAAAIALHCLAGDK